MATRSSSLIVLPAAGGLVGAIDNSFIPADAWAHCINGEYTPLGTIKTRPGIARVNTTAVEPTAANKGAFLALGDFNRYAVSSGALTVTHKRVAVIANSAQTGIYKEDLDGTWDSLLNPWGTGTYTKLASIAFADGFAVFFNGFDAPQKWDGTTLSALGASAPVGTGAAWHLRRLFVVGEASGDGSTVKYCAASDITDWTGGDTGSLPAFSENDGDYVIGVSQSLDGKLYFFKGPNVGSIHELSGNTPATWQTRQVASGVPCIGYRSVVTTGQDVYWCSRDVVHSLRQMLSTGDSVISRPLERYMTGVNYSAQTYGFHDPLRQIVGWVIGSGTNIHVYNYYHKKWTTWTLNGPGTLYSGMCSINASSAALPKDLVFGDSNGIAYLMLGSNITSGAVYRDVNDTGTAQDLTLTLHTPVHYSFPGISPRQEKIGRSVTVYGRSHALASSGTDVTVAMQLRDEHAQASSVNMTLSGDTSTLNVCYADTPIECRSRWLGLEMTVASTAVRPEIAGYSITVDPGEDISYEAA